MAQTSTGMRTMPESNGPQTLVVRGLGKNYQGRWLFRGVQFDLVAGQGLAVTGANGSGKSTMILCLAGQVEADEGTLTWHYPTETPLHQSSQTAARAAKRPALAAPYLELPGEFRVLELVNFHFSLNPCLSGHSPVEGLWASGIDPHSPTLLKYYSSGMLQKVRLVLALWTDTPLLLLDEPHSHLDAAALSWFRLSLRQTAARRCWAMASNDPGEWDLCVHRIPLSQGPASNTP